MSELKLSKRLSTAASYVRSGAFVADIGTDHAYLPIYLVKQGKVKGALASDINEGPILKARENIAKYGLDEYIQTKVADGLDDIECFAPTDIVICGMGGELISRIISDSEYVKKDGVRLILQPMTMVAELRRFLSNGFSTVAENVVCEDGKIYQVMCVEYDGMVHTYSNLELELGKLNIKEKTTEYAKLLDAITAKKEKKYLGLKNGGYDTTQVVKELKELEKMKNDLL